MDENELIIQAWLGALAGVNYQVSHYQEGDTLVFINRAGDKWIEGQVAGENLLVFRDSDGRETWEHIEFDSLIGEPMEIDFGEIIDMTVEIVGVSGGGKGFFGDLNLE